MQYIPEDLGYQTVCAILLSLTLGNAKFSAYSNKCCDYKLQTLSRSKQQYQDVAQSQLAMINGVCTSRIQNIVVAISPTVMYCDQLK